MADNDKRYTRTDSDQYLSASGADTPGVAPDASSYRGASARPSRYSIPNIDGTGRFDTLRTDATSRSYAPNIDGTGRYDTLGPDSTGRYGSIPAADSTGRFEPLSPESTGRYTVPSADSTGRYSMPAADSTGRYDALGTDAGMRTTSGTNLPTKTYDAVDTSVSAHYDSKNSAYHTPYVRRQRPRRTQEAINDLEIDESYAQSFTHDSNVTVKGRNPLSGKVYSRSRANMPQLQRDLHYGQYLSIPKGRRQIFSSRDRSAAIRSRAITSLIIVVLIIIAIIAWMLIMESVS